MSFCILTHPFVGVLTKMRRFSYNSRVTLPLCSPEVFIFARLTAPELSTMSKVILRRGAKKRRFGWFWCCFAPRLCPHPPSVKKHSALTVVARVMLSVKAIADRNVSLWFGYNGAISMNSVNRSYA